MKRVLNGVVPALALFVAALPTIADGKKSDEKTTKLFTRVTYNEEKVAQTFDTSIVRYEPADGEPKGLVVDLVSAVHVGEKAYYEALNKEFDNYDAVLYEFVAPEGMIPQKNAKQQSFVTRIQHVVKNVLELDFQLDEVKYDKDNFVHADMTPRQFAQSMRDRGETFFTMMMKIMMNSYAAESAKGKGVNQDLQILVAFFRTDRAVVLKRIMAEQFSDLDVLNAAVSGPDGSTLITDRNDVALKVLRREIDNGKKRIAIFYGCGHMPDFHEKLLKDFGLKKTESRWLVAWDMRTSAAPTTEAKE